MVSARRLALGGLAVSPAGLGGLAVAPAGLGGLAAGLPPRLGSLRLGTLQARSPPLLGRPLGRPLQGDLPPGLRAPGRDGRTDGFPVLLAVAVGGALEGSLAPGLRALGRRLPGPLAPLPPCIVRVRHRFLPAASASLMPQPLEHPRQPRPPRLDERRLEPVGAGLCAPGLVPGLF